MNILRNEVYINNNKFAVFVFIIGLGLCRFLQFLFMIFYSYTTPLIFLFQRVEFQKIKLK